MSLHTQIIEIEKNIRRNLRDIPTSIDRLFDKETRLRQKECLENLRKEFNALIVKPTSVETYNEMLVLDGKSHELLTQCNDAVGLIRDVYKQEILDTIERLKKKRDEAPTDTRYHVWNTAIVTLNNTYKLTVHPGTNEVTEEDFEALRRILPNDDVEEPAPSKQDVDALRQKVSDLANLYDKFREAAKRAEAVPDSRKLVVPGFKKGRHIQKSNGENYLFGIAEFQSAPMFTIETNGYVAFAIITNEGEITSNRMDQIHIFEPLLDIIIKDY